MIGAALKNLAKENNLTVSNGIAYGNFHGYAVSFSEGMGYKLMVIATRFADTAGIDSLRSELNSHNLMKEFRVQNIDIAEDAIIINFYDTMGTMKKLMLFADWIFPLLPRFSALGIEYCSECGTQLAGQGTWKLINGMAFYIHESCADKIQRDAAEQEREEKAQGGGSYIKGFVGAMLGGIVGAIPWAILLYLGYFASIVGFVIGWLANKGYELLNGKRGKGKIVILILASIVGVVIGTFAVDIFTFIKLMNAGELPGATFGDIIPTIINALKTDPEYLRVTLANIGVGLLFALLGMSIVLINAFRETKSFKMKSLEDKE